MKPLVGSEMAKARVEELHRAAEQARLARSARRERRWSARSDPSWRLALGIRLVSAGFRLMGDSREPNLAR